MMRTTIDLPSDLHSLTRDLAHQQGKTLSQVVTELLRLALQRPAPPSRPDADGGWPVVRIGRTITAADVRSLEDE